MSMKHFVSERTYILTEDILLSQKTSPATGFKVPMIHYCYVHNSAGQFEHIHGSYLKNNNYIIKSNDNIMILHSQNLVEYAFIKIFRIGFHP